LKTFTIAHSEDADDIFMYYSINFGWVSKSGYKFDNSMSDIQTLNNGAKNNKFEMCAISFALFPLIKNDYSLLNTAISFGYGYGPKLIAKKEKVLKKNFSVAISGEDTTNALLFKMKYPDAKIIYMNFLKIQQAVLSGIVDAGILIHEDILTFDSSLKVECELYDIWVDLACGEYPLPLGGMVLKKSLPLLDAISCQELLQKAVVIANNNREFLIHMLYEVLVPLTLLIFHL
jgi:1,4-dihydroxy-6-naphthoate synthase